MSGPNGNRIWPPFESVRRVEVDPLTSGDDNLSATAATSLASLPLPDFQAFLQTLSLPASLEDQAPDPSSQQGPAQVILPYAVEPVAREAKALTPARTDIAAHEYDTDTDAGSRSVISVSRPTQEALEAEPVHVVIPVTHASTFQPSLRLSGAYICDATVPDGQVFPPGAEFVKSWRMCNDGDIPWPDQTELVFVAGERLMGNRDIPHRVRVGAVAKGATVDVWTGELKAPESPGRYVSYWRLSLGDGTLFGHSIWIDITVEEPSRHLKGASDEASLASSSIVMPASAPVRSASTHATVSDMQNVQHSPSSHATAVSRLTLEDAVSDDGSDASSVSLISVPSSEDVEDDEVWQDSRSHVVVTSPERARAALEYVVLYDESSEEEL